VVSLNNSKAADSSILFVLGVLYTWAITFAVISCTVILADPFSLFFTSLVIFAILSIIFYNKYTMIISAAIIVLALLFMVGSAYYSGYQPGAVDFFGNVYLFVTGEGPYTAEYGRAVVTSLAVLVALFAIVFMKLIFSYWTLVLFGVAMFVLSIISGYFNNDISFIVFIFCVLALTIIKCNTRVFKNKHQSAEKQRGGKIAPAALPVCLAVIILASVIPLNPGQVSMGAFIDGVIRRPYHRIRDGLMFAFEPRYFSFENTGFGSRDGRLGGNVNMRNDFVMYVRTSSDSPAYLVGAINDFYTGYSWINTRPGMTDYARADIDIVPLSFWVGYWNEFALRPLMFLNMGNNAEMFYQLYFTEHEQLENRFQINDGSYANGTFTVTRHYVYRYASVDYETDFIIEFSEPRIGNDYIFYGHPSELRHTLCNIEPDRGLLVQREPHLSAMDVFIATQLHASRWANAGRRVMYSQVEVDIASRRTGSLFLPTNFTHMVEFVDRGTAVNDFSFLRVSQNGIMQTARTMRRNTRYTMAYFEHHRNSSPLGRPQIAVPRANPLAQSHVGLYQQIIDDFSRLMFDNPTAVLEFGITHNTHPFMFNGESYNLFYLLEQILIPRTNVINEVFTQLPETLPPRVRAYAQLITHEAENDFQRAEALTRYLRELEYTLSPGDVPLDRDFVDYFIFDGRQGYCVYFATALVVMARALGMPARYMEGYIVTSNQNLEGWRWVDNSTAHAWAEIYFEGYGWVRFEPTPAYDDVARTPITTPERDPGDSPAPPPMPPGTDWYDPEMDGYDWRPESPGGIITGNDYDDYTGGGAGLLRYIIAAVAALIGLALAITAARAIKYKLHMKRLGRLSNNDAANAYFKLILKYAKFNEQEIRVYETPNAYAERLGERFFFNNEQMFMKDLSNVFTKAQYSGREITNNELSVMAIAYNEFINKMKQEMHWARFLFYRYTLNKV